MAKEILIKAVASPKATNKSLQDSILETAKTATLECPSNSVYLKYMEKNGKCMGVLVYTKAPYVDEDGNKAFSPDTEVALVREVEQKSYDDSEWGHFGDIAELKEIVSAPHKAEIVSRPKPRVLYIRVSEADEEVFPNEKPPKTGDEATEEAVSRTGLSKEAIEERKIELASFGISEKTSPRFLEKVLDGIRRQPEGCEVKKPNKLYRPLGKDDTSVIQMLSSILNGSPLCLEGPKSTGKNVLWETIAWLLNCELFINQCGPNMSRASMLGFSSTDPSIKDGITTDGAKSLLSALKGLATDEESFDEAATFLEKSAKAMSPELIITPGPVTQAMQHCNAGYGSILLLDEMNLSNPSVLSETMNVITDKHSDGIFVTGLGKVALSPDLIVGATQNAVEGGYLGTKLQNEATMSRFDFLELEAQPSILSILRQERDLKSLPVTDDVLQLVDEIYKEFQSLVINSGKSDSCLNVRGFLRSLSLYSDGISLAKAIENAVVNTVNPKEQRIIFRETIDNIIPDEVANKAIF